MAESMKDVWQKFKAETKDMNADFVAGQKANIEQAKARSKEISAEGKEQRATIEKPSLKGVSGTRKLWAVWVALLTAPLMIFAVILFVAAMLLFWDAIFGL